MGRLEKGLHVIWPCVPLLHHSRSWDAQCFFPFASRLSHYVLTSILEKCLPKNGSSSSLTGLFLLSDKDEADHSSPTFILSYFLRAKVSNRARNLQESQKRNLFRETSYICSVAVDSYCWFISLVSWSLGHFMLLAHIFLTLNKHSSDSGL